MEPHRFNHVQHNNNDAIPLTLRSDCRVLVTAAGVESWFSQFAWTGPVAGTE